MRLSSTRLEMEDAEEVQQVTQMSLPIIQRDLAILSSLREAA